MKYCPISRCRHESLYVHPFVYRRARITFRSANKFVAESVYPNEGENARKRVRARIRRAQRDDEIPLDDPMDAAKFFRWAYRVSNWEVLRGIEGLPIEPLEVSETATIEIVIGISSEKVTTPGDVGELTRENQMIKSENRRLKAELEAQLSELEQLRAMAQRIRRQAREKGRMVGKRDHHGKLKKPDPPEDPGSGS